MNKVRVLGIDYKINYIDMIKIAGVSNTGNVINAGCVINVDSNENSPVHLGLS